MIRQTPSHNGRACSPLAGPLACMSFCHTPNLLLNPAGFEPRDTLYRARHPVP